MVCRTLIGIDCQTRENGGDELEGVGFDQLREGKVTDMTL